MEVSNRGGLAERVVKGDPSPKGRTAHQHPSNLREHLGGHYEFDLRHTLQT